MKQYGTLKGIPVYRVEKFNQDLADKGYIQLVGTDRDAYWKIYTDNRAVADGFFDREKDNTTLFDSNEFDGKLKKGWKKTRVVEEREKKEEENWIQKTLNSSIWDLYDGEVVG